MLDLDACIDKVPIAFLDLETTGLRPEYGDRICEVAILRCEGGEVVDALQQLVNPQQPMSAGAYAVHGIGDEVLHEAPIFSEVARDLFALVEGAVLIGHNAPFDLGFLAQEMARLGNPMPSNVCLDTLRLARVVYRLRSYSLGNLAASLGVNVGGRAHRAMVDVLLTKGVFERLVRDLWSREVRSVHDLIAAQGGPLAFPHLSDCVPPLIQEALREKRLLHLRYLSDRGEETERMVQPLGVWERGGNVFLIAHCFLRDARRTFRLDRILRMDIVQFD